MAGIAAIHDALGNIDSASGHILFVSDIKGPVNDTAVNAHAQFDFVLILESFADLDCASCRTFRVTEEDQSHAVAGRSTD